MAINVMWISLGLSLIKLVVDKIWDTEGDTGKSGNDKKAYVKPFVEAFLKENNAEVKEVDGLIDDIVELLNKYNMFKHK